MLERPPPSCLGDWSIPLFHLGARAAPTPVAILWLSRALRPVPRTMLRDKRAAPVTLRKLLPGIKRELQRRHMRAKQYVRDDCARNELWLLRLDAWINVVPDVAVRPAVESSIFQRREVIRGKIVSQFVAFVDRRPYLSRHRLQRHPHRIPQPGSVQPRILAVWIADGHGRAARIFPGVNIRTGANTNEQMLPVRRKRQRTRFMSARWQIHQVLCFAKPL